LMITNPSRFLQTFPRIILPRRLLQERERILTDCGTESTPWHEEAIPTHEVEKTCNRLWIKHATTKVKHPWTNGYGERLNKTPLDEFYAVAFRKKQYKSIEERQIDPDSFYELL